MDIYPFNENRTLRTEEIAAEFVVVGGGLAGVCAAISAARRAVKVCLIQDRPVLGGNASSEVRVWALGATSHMGNNNRFSREGGIIDELMTENLRRNREGNPVLFDMVMMDKVLAEENIRLLLNTAVYDVDIEDSEQNYSKKETLYDDSALLPLRRIRSVTAFCPSCETAYRVSGRLFADCSGDGILSWLSGVTARTGAEDRQIYGEAFAPDVRKYGELMGDTIFFYMKDTGRPVKYVAPDFALKDVGKYISKLENSCYFNTSHHGCKYWWIEWGGRMDTVHDTEEIKRELWKVVYGIWDYIKNSGKYPEMLTYTLEWVGTIPGKRESRRMKGLYTLTQNDIVSQRHFDDAVSYGGWAIDLHPADGVYAPGSACNQWHSKGVYQIPWRCFVGDEVANLFFAGRIISTSHVANGSTRVMCTGAHGAEAVGTVAALCLANGLKPADYAVPEKASELRIALEEDGHFVPGFAESDSSNLLNSAVLTASSTWHFRGFKPNSFRRLDRSMALVLPLMGIVPAFRLFLKAEKATVLHAELRTSAKVGNYTPEKTVDVREISVNAGESSVTVAFDAQVPELQYCFLTLRTNPLISVGVSAALATGVVTVFNQKNEAVSNNGRQTADGNGFESFEFWCPDRRPEARNLALEFTEPVPIYSTELFRNPYKRPYIATNAWASDPEDKDPWLRLHWTRPVEISRLILFFDTDFDHAMETVQMGHPESVMPQCVRNYRILDGYGRTIYEKTGNYQAVNDIKLSKPISTDTVLIEFDSPAAMFHVIVRR